MGTNRAKRIANGSNSFFFFPFSFFGPLVRNGLFLFLLRSTPASFDSVLFGSVCHSYLIPFSSVLIDSVWSGLPLQPPSIRFCSVRLDYARFSSVQFGSIRYAPLGIVWFRSVRYVFGLVRFGSVVDSDRDESAICFLSVAFHACACLPFSFFLCPKRMAGIS